MKQLDSILLQVHTSTKCTNLCFVCRSCSSTHDILPSILFAIWIHLAAKSAVSPLGPLHAISKVTTPWRPFASSWNGATISSCLLAWEDWQQECWWRFGWLGPCFWELAPGEDHDSLWSTAPKILTPQGKAGSKSHPRVYRVTAGKSFSTPQDWCLVSQGVCFRQMSVAKNSKTTGHGSWCLWVCLPASHPPHPKFTFPEFDYDGERERLSPALSLGQIFKASCCTVDIKMSHPNSCNPLWFALGLPFRYSFSPPSGPQLFPQMNFCSPHSPEHSTSLLQLCFLLEYLIFFIPFINCCQILFSEMGTRRLIKFNLRPPHLHHPFCGSWGIIIISSQEHVLCKVCRSKISRLRLLSFSNPTLPWYALLFSHGVEVALSILGIWWREN